MTSGGGQKSGLVSDRAAIFEQQTQQTSSGGGKSVTSSQRPAKDPVELSLKERMQLFEKNKSDTPLLPKAPFGMPLPASKSQPSSNNNRKEQTTAKGK